MGRGNYPSPIVPPVGRSRIVEESPLAQLALRGKPRVCKSEAGFGGAALKRPALGPGRGGPATRSLGVGQKFMQPGCFPRTVREAILEGETGASSPRWPDDAMVCLVKGHPTTG